MRIMPRAKGKVYYKADSLIQVVEEKLPNGAQGWVEVAACTRFIVGGGPTGFQRSEEALDRKVLQTSSRN
jgi:hypothetical protein